MSCYYIWYTAPLSPLLAVPNSPSIDGGSRTFRYLASSPRGRFAIPPQTIAIYLDASLSGRFATWTFTHLDVSHLWTFRYYDVSLPPRTFRHCYKQVTKCPAWEVVKRPGTETSKGTKRLGAWPIVQVANRPSKRPDIESSKVVAKRP